MYGDCQRRRSVYGDTGSEHINSSHVRVPALALQVLNSSTLSPVLASPYMFARKVDLDVDPQVLDA